MPDKPDKTILTKALDPETLNVADDLTDEQLATIGAEIVELYQLDLNSREGWELKAERAMKLAKQTYEAKTFPSGEKSSSVKYPLLTDAAIQFASRAYPELLKGGDLVKCNITGKDDPMGTKEARSNRIATHMTWQLTNRTGVGCRTWTMPCTLIRLWAGLSRTSLRLGQGPQRLLGGEPGGLRGQPVGGSA